MKSMNDLRRHILRHLGHNEERIESILLELNAPPSLLNTNEVDLEVPDPFEHLPYTTPSCTLTQGDIDPIIERAKVEKRKEKSRKELAKSTTKVHKDTSPDSLRNIKSSLVQSELIP